MKATNSPLGGARPVELGKVEESRPWSFTFSDDFVKRPPVVSEVSFRGHEYTGDSELAPGDPQRASLLSSVGDSCVLGSLGGPGALRYALESRAHAWHTLLAVAAMDYRKCVDPRDVLVAIPAWNEQGSIGDVIAKVREHHPDCGILVVDDGSTDRTAVSALQAGAFVASLPFNVGVGGAMRTAFLFAQREGYSALVQVDADGQHDPADLSDLIAGLDDADIVVGTRFHPNSMYFVGGPRRWAMVLLSKALSWMNKGTISDPTSGFRAAGPRAIDLFAVNYPAEYLGDTVGSLSIAIRQGLVIDETPVTMYYRAIGRPSKNAVWSALYLGRATLAMVATFLQRGAPSKGDQT